VVEQRESGALCIQGTCNAASTLRAEPAQGVDSRGFT
jgi:hypothetical protein